MFRATIMLFSMIAIVILLGLLYLLRRSKVSVWIISLLIILVFVANFVLMYVIEG